MNIIVLIFIIAGISPCFSSNPWLNNSLYEADDYGCACEMYSCTCYFVMVVPEISLNDTAYVGFTYLPDEYGIIVTLRIDDDVIINQTISARNPPPICTAPRHMEKILHLCLRFYDIDVTSALFHYCVKIEVKMFHDISLKEWKFRCFDIDLVNVRQMEYLEKIADVEYRTARTDPKKKFLREKSVNKKILTPNRW